MLNKAYEVKEALVKAGLRVQSRRHRQEAGLEVLRTGNERYSGQSLKWDRVILKPDRQLS